MREQDRIEINERFSGFMVIENELVLSPDSPKREREGASIYQQLQSYREWLTSCNCRKRKSLAHFQDFIFNLAGLHTRFNN